MFLLWTNKNLNKAFTLAEILLSLSIIGVVAAIALPSLLGNVHERAFETQKKALYTRFSQSIPLLPSLNGYGQLEGTLSEGTKGQEGYVPQSVTVDTATESFVRDGLSKVMKITNICDSEHLSDCDLPNKINPTDGNSPINLSDMKALGKYRAQYAGRKITNIDHNLEYEQLDTKAAAFETVNGESILVYYNPNCQADLNEIDAYFVQSKICANFIYNLNGIKGPNTMGKDIEIITVLYSVSPVVVSSIPYGEVYNDVSFSIASEKCRTMNESTRLPTIDELTAMTLNKPLVVMSTGGDFWSGTAVNSTNAWVHGIGGERRIISKVASTSKSVRCIRR